MALPDTKIGKRYEEDEGDMSFRTALAADFRREYKIYEFSRKQRPGVGSVAALPPAAVQIPGKHLWFLVTKATVVCI